MLIKLWRNISFYAGHWAWLDMRRHAVKLATYLIDTAQDDSDAFGVEIRRRRASASTLIDGPHEVMTLVSLWRD